jgi:hypothetical protein
MHTFLIQNKSGSRSTDLQLNSSFTQGARILFHYAAVPTATVGDFPAEIVEKT